MDRSPNLLDTVNQRQATDPATESQSSDLVGWQVLSTQTDSLDDMGTASQHVADRIRARSGESLTIETGAVRATLVGVPHVRVDDLVYAHHRDRLEASTRPCALFDVENTSSAPINWTSRQTKFIGTDDYTYRHSHISLDPSKLGPGCYPSQIEIEPGCRARIITPVEQLPSSVGVSKVIQQVTFRGRLASQKLTYTL